MKARHYLLSAGVAALWATVPLAHAQEASSDCIIGKTVGEVSQTCLSDADFESRLDLTVPSNALFTLMGAAPDNVIRPVPGEKITASFLPDLADALGNKEAGFAVEVRPALFITPDRYTYGELQGQVQQALSGSADRVAKLGRAKRWAPFNATIAVSRGEEGVQPERAGLGVNYTYDSADPMFSSEYGNCLADRAKPLDVQAQRQALETVDLAARQAAEKAAEQATQQSAGQPPEQIAQRAAQAADRAAAEINADSARLQAALDKAYEALKGKIDGIVDACARESSPWNRNMLAAGIAAYRSSPTDDTVEAESGFGLWFSKSFKLGDSGQLIVHGRHTDDALQEAQIAGVKALHPTDNTSIGMRYTRSVTGDGPTESLSSDIVRGIVEIGSIREKIEGQPTDDYWQVALGAEFRLQRNLYFQVLFGDAKGSIQDRDEFFNGQIKWSFSSAAMK